MNLDSEDDAYKIREPQDGDEVFEKSVITSLTKLRRELENDN